MNDPRSVHGEYAGFASRAAASLIDTVVIAVVTFVFTWAVLKSLAYVGIDLRDCESLEGRRPILAGICNSLLWLGPFTSAAFVIAYGLFFWSATGQTPGKAAMGVRVVRLDGRPMNMITAARRVAGYTVSLWTFSLGFLVILSDDRRQGWHDKIAGTCVVYSWGDVPAAAPRPRAGPSREHRTT